MAKDQHTAQRQMAGGMLGRSAAALVAAIAVHFAVGSTAVEAQGPGRAPTPNPEQSRETLDKSRRDLDVSRQRTKGIEKSIAQIQADRERLSDNLRETARIIHDSEARLTAIEHQQAGLAAQERKIREALAERHGKIAILLGAMQRMGRNPPPVMITRREDALQMVRSAMILARAFPELSEQATSLAKRLDDLVKVMEASKIQSAALRAETASHEQERTRLAQLIESRRQSLAQHQPELEAAKRHAEETARRITDLTTLIARLDSGPAGSTHTASGPAQPPVLPADLPGTAPTEHLKDAGSAVVAIPDAAKSIVELRPTGRDVASLDPTPMRPAVPFAQAKGSLPLPAQGKRVLGFGDKTQFGAQSMGTVFETRHSAQVRSPSDGRIIYAGEFRTWGQLLIINADGGYHILLAGLAEINVQAGEFVLAGETVGFMSAAPRSSSAKPDGNAPVLYVEFRKENRPIDPEPWWNVRS
ncbi:MAG: peptidoglycan DD-metalloendopeptidase family protein [Hyphomicrobiaceae bacterium]